jgi:hypothetical protein
MYWFVAMSRLAVPYVISGFLPLKAPSAKEHLIYSLRNFSESKNKQHN